MKHAAKDSWFPIISEQINISKWGWEQSACGPFSQILSHMHTLISNLDHPNSLLSERFCLVPASSDNRGYVYRRYTRYDDQWMGSPVLMKGVTAANAFHKSGRELLAYALVYCTLVWGCEVIEEIWYIKLSSQFENVVQWEANLNAPFSTRWQRGGLSIL